MGLYMSELRLRAQMGALPGVTPFVLWGTNAAMTTSIHGEVISPESSTLTVLRTAAATPFIVSDSANDTAAGTGARTVTVTGVTSTYALASEVLTLNGTTAVNMAGSYIGINSMTVETAGSNGINAGNIYVGTGGPSAGKPTAVVDCMIPGTSPIATNVHCCAMYTVPASYRVVILDLFANLCNVASAATAPTQTISYETSTNLGLKRRRVLASTTLTGGPVFLPTLNLTLPEKTQFALFGASTAANTTPFLVYCNALLINDSIQGDF